MTTPNSATLDAPTDRPEYAPFGESHHEAFYDQLGHYRMRVVKNRSRFDKTHYWLSHDEFAGNLSRFEYAGLATNRFTRVLVLDADHSLLPGKLSHKHDQMVDILAEMPIRPNLYGINRSADKQSLQAVYYLDSEAFATGVERDMLRDTIRGLRQVFPNGGDTHANGPLSRNPSSNSREYSWMYLDDDPRSLSKMHEIWAPAQAEQILRQIEQQDRRGLFTPNGEGRRPIIVTYDLDGVQRKAYVHQVVLRAACSMRFLGQMVQSQELLTIGQNAATEICAQDNHRRPRLSEAWLQRNADRTAGWVNENLAPGRTTGTYSRYTPEQRRRGGEVQGKRNVESGHLAGVRELGAMANRMNAIENYTRIREYKNLNRLSIRKTAMELGISESTVKRALRDEL